MTIQIKLTEPQNQRPFLRQSGEVLASLCPSRRWTLGTASLGTASLDTAFLEFFYFAEGGLPNRPPPNRGGIGAPPALELPALEPHFLQQSLKGSFQGLGFGFAEGDLAPPPKKPGPNRPWPCRGCAGTPPALELPALEPPFLQQSLKGSFQGFAFGGAGFGSGLLPPPNTSIGGPCHGGRPAIEVGFIGQLETCGIPKTRGPGLRGAGAGGGVFLKRPIAEL
jgi:hypothetical protein